MGYGSSLYMKVIGSRSQERKSLFPQCKTLICNNSSSKLLIEYRAVKFACIMGFSGFRLCKIKWCDCHLCHVTIHLQVVCLRLEGSLVYIPIRLA